MKSITIESILQEKSITTHFQPIISLTRKDILGMEALSRGIDPLTKELIPPVLLFESAHQEEKGLDLDHLCLEKALENFQLLHCIYPNLFLFLNIDMSFVQQIGETDSIIHLCTQFRINPKNIVLEICESKITDVALLKTFIDIHRKKGFIIALDDVGAGFSNLDRIILVEPDVIKIDRCFVQDIHQDFCKQEVFKSLVHLAKKIGALVVAEGIEVAEEAAVAVELGADLLQGFYFSKPLPITYSSLENVYENINAGASYYEHHMLEKIQQQRELHLARDLILTQIVKELSQIPQKSLDDQLTQILPKYSSVECMYIVNQEGIQISMTACSFQCLNLHKNSMFQPARKNTDHHLKPYYYCLMHNGTDRYTTEPYISLATGNLCITVYHLFITQDGMPMIACLDLRV